MSLKQIESLACIFASGQEATNILSHFKLQWSGMPEHAQREAKWRNSKNELRY